MWKSIKRWWSNLFKTDDEIEHDTVGEMREPNIEPSLPLEDLIEAYKKTDIQFPHLKPITLAQWLLESGRGTSDLATKHFNFSGLKWRPEMVGYAEPVVYEAHDGEEEYCKFKSIEAFIIGYWHFLTREPYIGWETRSDEGDEFLQFIVDSGFCPDNGYVGKVTALLPEAIEELEGFIIEPIEPEKPVDPDGHITKYVSGAKDLYYPKAVRLEGVRLKTGGTYSNNYPLGSVPHFTAGRSRPKLTGGSRNTDTVRERGERGIKSADDRNAYCYFLIDRDGTVYQSFPLNRYGSHAGESKWPGLGSNVSRKLVGIEMQNAGKLKDYWQKKRGGKKYKCPEGKLAAWFTRPDLGDEYFDKETECRYSEGEDNIQEGWYHKLSDAQEKSLLELNIWMKINNPSVFNLNYILPHDEVSGKKGIGFSRKNDTGASLSMTATEFRALAKETFKERYN